MRLKRGYLTRKTAADALKEILVDVKRGQYVEPAKITLATWMAEWLDGLRLGPSTMASYRKYTRLHIDPYLGTVPLDKLSGPMITATYRKLETSGRADYKAGTALSARTVRYTHTILKASLKSAVRNGKLLRNPAEFASPPSAKEARAPEMHPWTAEQLSSFLTWAKPNREDVASAWHVLAYTGMRRGELLGLRWRDVDLDSGRIHVRRSRSAYREKGQGLTIVEGATKTGRGRVVDLDQGTVDVLRAHRVARAALALQLAKPDAYVFANEEGEPLHPDRFTRRFTEAVASCARHSEPGEGVEPIPSIRLHDLRHTHATLLLGAGVPVKVVSERLGHASATITMNVYQHVMPGMQQEAALKFAAIVGGAQ
jgi:integrase